MIVPAIGMLARLRDAVKDAGTLSALARTLGTSPGYLSNVLAGRRQPSAALLTHLGLRAQHPRRRVPKGEKQNYVVLASEAS